ncbi:MAG: HU family DNA-binding protein [Prevotellaceae bacterium]|nr:HU family DNA-binding protein [Prevotellaceae bacterium]
MELKCVLMRNSMFKGKAGEKIYPKVLNYNQMPSEQFIETVAAAHQLSTGEIKSVLAGIADILALEIGSGHSVTIDGLGTFSVSMTGEAVADKRGVLQLKDAAVSKVNFLPAKSFKAALSDVKFTLINHNVNDATKLDADEALRIAGELTKDKGFFLCRDLAKAAGVSYDYARRTIAALASEGKLKYEYVGRSKVFRTL